MYRIEKEKIALAFPAGVFPGNMNLQNFTAAISFFPILLSFS